jgi:tetratricopeptide (TPR) repeat protein
LSPQRFLPQVSLTDVMPTLLSLLGLEQPEQRYDGLDLTPYLGAEHPDFPDRALALECYGVYFRHGWAPFEGIVYGPYKYIHSRAPQLFDRRTDAAEQVNLFAPDDETSRRLAARLESLFAEPQISLPESQRGVSEEERERLAALGYAGSGARHDSERPAFESLPSALDKVEILRALDTVTEHTMHGRHEEAIELLAEMTLAEPDSPELHLALGVELMRHRKERLDEAEMHLQRALELGSRGAVVHSKLGICGFRRFKEAEQAMLRHEKAGETEAAARKRAETEEHRLRAIARLELALEHDPYHPETLSNTAKLLLIGVEQELESGPIPRPHPELAKALSYLERWLDVVPPDDPAWNGYDKTKDYWRRMASR